jgi:hypothetical protein
MTTQLLFYSQAVPITAQRHKDLCVKTGTDYHFAQHVNSVPLTAAEFPLAAPEYAIVFAGTDESVFPVVILGGKKDQNAYVDADGRWNGQYVPAFVRRYPFVFAQTESSTTFMLCIDESFSGCNREGRGERLFDTAGERTAYLEQVLNFQKAYQVQHLRTQAFCKRLVELDLLQPVQAQLRSPSGESRVLGGLRVVNRNKLKELDTDTLRNLLRSDELELAFLHLHSLVNLRRIGERLAMPAEDTAPAAAAPLPTLAEMDVPGSTPH